MLDLFDVCNRTVLYVSHDIDEACRLCQRICVMHDGHVEELGSVEDVVRRPQTLAALRLTGCKNTSRARKIGDEEVEALDWGMTFNVGREVPDNVAYLGVAQAISILIIALSGAVTATIACGPCERFAL